MLQEGTTQGNQLAMPIYRVVVVSLIRMLNGCSTKVWYADHLAAAGKIAQMRQ